MIPQSTIETAILTAQLKLATMTNSNLTKLSGGSLSAYWGSIQKGQRGVNAVSRQYNLGDYGSPNFLIAYDCLQTFIGNFGAGSLNPNAQNPNTTINIAIEGAGNFIRIPFANQTTVTLTDFQNTYAPIYGDYAIVTIWITQDDYATSQQDTLTTPIITNLSDDINKPDAYEWDYPVPTTGYVQINGFNPVSATTQGLLPPITNTSPDLLSNATLNSLYGFAKWGQLVLLPNVPAKYEKMDDSPTGQWDLQTYTPNT